MTIDGINVTNEIVRRRGVALTVESEDAAFERRIGDVRVTFSTISGIVPAIFAGMKAQDVFLLDIREGRRTFIGMVENDTIMLSDDRKELSLTAYSFEKKFWELANDLDANYIPESQRIMFPDAMVIQAYLARYLQPMTAIGLFGAINTDDYPDLTIRYQNQSGQHPNDIGLYVLLQDSTTVGDVLRFLSVNLNAEFTIDPETLTLYMRTREEPSSRTPVNFDAVMLRDPIDADFYPVHRDRYDYIRSYAKIDPPDRPEFIKTEQSTIILPGNAGHVDFGGYEPGFYEFLVTAFIEGVETQPSEVLVVEVPDRGLTQAGTKIRSKIFLRILPYLEGTTERWLYENQYQWPEPSGSSVFRRVAKFHDVHANDIFEWEQVARGVGDQKLTLRPIYAVAAWYGYNDADGWQEPILDTQDGKNRPQGRIFDAIQPLSFTDPNGMTIADSAYASFLFLSEGVNLAAVQNFWVGLMRTRRAFECGVTGTDYALRDPFTSPSERLPQDFTSATSYFLKRAVIHYTPDKEYTEATLVSV